MGDDILVENPLRLKINIHGVSTNQMAEKLVVLLIVPGISENANGAGFRSQCHLISMHVKQVGLVVYWLT